MLSPQEMQADLTKGLLSFPVTHFDSSLQFAEPAFRDHVEWLLGFKPSGLFAAGGTGEVFSLTPEEIGAVVRAAVEQVAGRIPVIASCGFSGQSAVELAVSAEQAGADGLLVFPPYLVEAEQGGLEQRIGSICAATSLGIIVYNRDNGVLGEDSLARLCDKHANLVGVKDGLGDLELMVRIRAKLGDRLMYIGGLPTAEIFAAPYATIGMSTYSSAVFNFMPAMAMRFFAAFHAGDTTTMWQLLNDFYIPYIKLRSRRKGYAVSIVKAGMTLIGRHPGPVRPPLTSLDADEMDTLAKLVAANG